MEPTAENSSSWNKLLNQFYPLGFKEEALLIIKNAVPLVNFAQG